MATGNISVWTGEGDIDDYTNADFAQREGVLVISHGEGQKDGAVYAVGFWLKFTMTGIVDEPVQNPAPTSREDFYAED